MDEKSITNNINEKIQLTSEGVKEKAERLKTLIKVIRPEILEQLSEARSQGDLSENADYDAAKEKQAEVEAEIQDLETILSKVEVIKKSSSKKIGLGATVTYQKINDKLTKKIKVVGSIEADPMAAIPLVGSDSPLGKAIIGSEIGTTVTVLANNKYDIIIKKAE